MSWRWRVRRDDLATRLPLTHRLMRGGADGFHGAGPCFELIEQTPALPSCRAAGLKMEKFSKSVNSESESCCRTWAI
ncbi:hypothetical protein HNP02_005327 [Mycobacterium sp. AZCC_0083]|nr:hypothetical protein [Mycobacterium sp. AZCC_0083]